MSAGRTRQYRGHTTGTACLLLVAVVLCALTLACSDSKSASPTTPTPTPAPTPTPTPTYTLSGRVTENPFTPIPGATVSVADGPDAGKSATSDPGGAYKISGLSASTFTLNASASGYQSRSMSVALTADQTLDIQLTRNTQQ